MTLRFHRTLYAGTAIDAALQRFAGVANTTFTRREDGDYFVVEIASTTDARTKKIARELGNFALGLTIEKGGPDQ